MLSDIDTISSVLKTTYFELRPPLVLPVFGGDTEAFWLVVLALNLRCAEKLSLWYLRQVFSLANPLAINFRWIALQLAAILDYFHRSTFQLQLAGPLVHGIVYELSESYNEYLAAKVQTPNQSDQ